MFFLQGVPQGVLRRRPWRTPLLQGILQGLLFGGKKGDLKGLLQGVLKGVLRRSPLRSPFWPKGNDVKKKTNLVSFPYICIAHDEAPRFAAHSKICLQK